MILPFLLVFVSISLLIKISLNGSTWLRNQISVSKWVFFKDGEFNGANADVLKGHLRPKGQISMSNSIILAKVVIIIVYSIHVQICLKNSNLFYSVDNLHLHNSSGCGNAVKHWFLPGNSACNQTTTSSFVYRTGCA